MSDYFSVSPLSPDRYRCGINFASTCGGPLDGDGDDGGGSPPLPPTASAAPGPHYYGPRPPPPAATEAACVINPSQPKCIDRNDNGLLTWNISLADDQDEVSKRFLKIFKVPEPETTNKMVRPPIFAVPENIRKQADELLKPLEINKNEMVDTVNSKISWLLTINYQQYLKSIPLDVLEKQERYVLYPWTQWNTSTGTPNRPLLTSAPLTSVFTSSSASSSSSSTSLDRSSLSPASTSSLYSHVIDSGRSANSSVISRHNNNNSNSYGYFDGRPTSWAVAADTSNASDLSYGSNNSEPNNAQSRQDPWSQKPSPHLRFEARDDQQKPVTFTAADTPRSPDDSDNDVCSSQPQSTVGWPSRLYYCVNSTSNTVNKLVGHYCTFCYKNHEPPDVYSSHLVRDAVRTTCPKLRRLRCKHCYATGDNAHTIKYCPYLYANYK